MALIIERIVFKSVFCVTAFSAGIAWGCVAEAGTSTPEPTPRSVQCSAAFELMERVAPDWSKQHVARQARKYWRADLSTLVARAGLDADTQIGQEMQAMANAAATDPGVITDTAMQCVGDADLPKRKRFLGVF